MLSAEERYRLLEEVSELSERWDYASVLRLLETIPVTELQGEPELGCFLAYAFYHTSQRERARTLAESLVGACASRGRDRLYCRRLLITANVAVDYGNLAGGTEAYLEVLALADAVSDNRMIAAATMNLATVAWLKCDYATALTSFERAIVAYTALSDSYRLAGCHHNLAMVYKELGLLKESAQQFDVSRTLFTRCGGATELAFSDYERALVMHMRGESAAAEVVAAKALATVQGLKLGREEGEALRVLGIIHRDSGDHERARHEFNDALALARQSQIKLLTAEILEEEAILHEEIREEELAIEKARLAGALYSEMGATTRTARVESRVLAARRSRPAT